MLNRHFRLCVIGFLASSMIFSGLRFLVPATSSTALKSATSASSAPPEPSSNTAALEQDGTSQPSESPKSVEQPSSAPETSQPSESPKPVEQPSSAPETSQPSESPKSVEQPSSAPETSQPSENPKPVEQPSSAPETSQPSESPKSVEHKAQKATQPVRQLSPTPLVAQILQRDRHSLHRRRLPLLITGRSPPSGLTRASTAIHAFCIRYQGRGWPAQGRP